MVHPGPSNLVLRPISVITYLQPTLKLITCMLNEVKNTRKYVCEELWCLNTGVQHRMVLVVNFFVFLKSLFCFVVAIYDLAQYTEAIFHLPLPLTASGNIF